jgi:hypothetical protein
MVVLTEREKADIDGLYPSAGTIMNERKRKN